MLRLWIKLMLIRSWRLELRIDYKVQMLKPFCHKWNLMIVLGKWIKEIGKLSTSSILVNNHHRKQELKVVKLTKRGLMEYHRATGDQAVQDRHIKTVLLKANKWSRCSRSFTKTSHWPPKEILTTLTNNTSLIALEDQVRAQLTINWSNSNITICKITDRIWYWTSIWASSLTERIKSILRLRRVLDKAKFLKVIRIL